MDKKLLIITISSILTLALLVFFVVLSWDYFTKESSQPITARCGDGICQDIEKQNNVCPEDCTTEQTIQTENILLPDLPQQPENPDFIYGLWVGRLVVDDKDLIEPAFKTSKNLGVKYVKLEFRWTDIEPRNNQWQWKGKSNYAGTQSEFDYDYVVEMAQQYNLSVIPYFAPELFPWGERIVTEECKDENRLGIMQAADPEEFAEFVYKVIERYKDEGSIKYVAIDNELSNNNDGYNSYGCHYNTTAAQLVELENSAYDRAKADFPDIMISSTTFTSVALGKDIIQANNWRNSYVKAYFEASPKFDFLGIHDYSGGIVSTKDNGADKEWDFLSYSKTFQTWRNILEGYGYENTPIFVLEGGIGSFGGTSSQSRMEFKPVELLQKYISSVTQAAKYNIVGRVYSSVTPSGILPGNDYGITDLTNSKTELRSAYYAYYAMMNTLANYPNYEGRLVGGETSLDARVEKFCDDDNNILYVVFVPYDETLKAKEPQTVNLQIGSNKEVKITKPDTTTSTMKSDSDGYITLEVDVHPVFVEETTEKP